MIQLSSPWSPNLRPLLGVARSLRQGLPAANPMPAPAPSAGHVAAGLGAGLLTVGVAGLGAAFAYGIAKESKSKLVKTTGYIIAGLGAVAAILDGAAIGVQVAKGA